LALKCQSWKGITIFVEPKPRFMKKKFKKKGLELGLIGSELSSFSLSDIHKVWKFYWISVWNVETRHLMHKVEDYIIQVGVMKIYVETMEALTKKKTWSNSIYHQNCVEDMLMIWSIH
jgi:hypothetical protein